MKAHQEDATERELKRTRREHPLEFNRKSYEEQFHFNLQLQAMEDLQEGSASVNDRQKISVWPTPWNGWGAVKDSTKMVKSDR